MIEHEHHIDQTDGPEHFGPRTMGCHEALHMCSFLATAVDNELVDHPAIKQVPEWLRLAEIAAEALASLYNEIGSIHIPCTPTPPSTERS